MKPFNRRIQIEPIERTTTIVSGEDPFTERGTVVAVGDAVTFAKVGDVLLFTSFGIDKVKVEDTDYYFVLEDDAFILAKE